MCRSSDFRYCFARAAHVIDDTADSYLITLCKCGNDLKHIVFKMRLDFRLTLRGNVCIVLDACINVIVIVADRNRTCYRDFISMCSREGDHQAVIHL